ncbi:DUF4142 domain-containing protein [Luteitalea sp. TBR-22]|uniref:DUF4142 domain-containing protein n=1 Tax=Luteitalea sp. TBR-22 TaxID=2802971 RepID=UPI001EF5F5B5|nr:DUF4142 domain-containing protein [Luteitalea sp. TBR-22]
MKQIYSLTGTIVIVSALAVVPAEAQSTQGQSGAPSGSRQSTGAGSSGQTTGSGSSARPQDRERDKVTSYGEKVGEDVPAAGTQTDQRGRTAAKGASDASGALKGPDRAFMLEAMEGNRAEVELARLAQQKADSQAVRDLAKMIETHHEQAGRKLQSIAASVGASDSAMDLKPTHKQLQERLSRLEGATFDKAYADEMVKDHQKDIQAYQKATRQLQHPALKTYATETLPTLEQHLDQARAAQQQTGSQPKTQ